MKLDEVDPSPVEEDDEDDDFDDTCMEQDLVDALSLLDDCSGMFNAIMALDFHKKLSPYMRGEMERIAQEIEIFIVDQMPQREEEGEF